MVIGVESKQLQELYQAVVGLPDNPDENGLIGDVKCLTALIREQNGRVRKNSKYIHILLGAYILAATIAGGMGVDEATGVISQLFGG